LTAVEIDDEAATSTGFASAIRADGRPNARWRLASTGLDDPAQDVETMRGTHASPTVPARR